MKQRQIKKLMKLLLESFHFWDAHAQQQRYATAICLAARRSQRRAHFENEHPIFGVKPGVYMRKIKFPKGWRSLPLGVPCELIYTGYHRYHLRVCDTNIPMFRFVKNATQLGPYGTFDVPGVERIIWSRVWISGGAYAICLYFKSEKLVIDWYADMGEELPDRRHIDTREYPVSEFDYDEAVQMLREYWSQMCENYPNKDELIKEFDTIMLQ